MQQYNQSGNICCTATSFIFHNSYTLLFSENFLLLPLLANHLMFDVHESVRLISIQVDFPEFRTNISFNFYLHVVHEDLSCHTHLQYPMYYEFTVRCQQIPSFVQILQLHLHLRIFTVWWSQMEPMHIEKGKDKGVRDVKWSRGKEGERG